MIVFNGKLVEQKDLILDPKNRAFRYGDALFETIKIIQGKAPLVNSHYSRLIRGMAALGFEIGEDFHLERFKQEIDLLVSSYTEKSGVFRFQVYRKEGGAYYPQNNQFHRLAEFTPSADQQVIFPQKASQYKIGIFKEIEKHFSPISFIKSSNALLYILAAKYSKFQGLDNVLICTGDHLIEAVSENLFLYQNGVVYTAPLSDGPVEGVMRSTVLKVLKWNGISVSQESISIDQLRQAEEVFLTNAVQGIIPVSQFEDVVYGDQFSRGLQAKIEERLMQLCAL